MKEPIFVLFVKDYCPYCKICYNVIVKGYLWSQLGIVTIIINISHYNGALANWWHEVAKAYTGKPDGTPAFVVFENQINFYKQPKNVFILSSKAKGYKIRSIRDQVFTLQDTIDEFLWEEFPEFMENKIMMEELTTKETEVKVIYEV